LALIGLDLLRESCTPLKASAANNQVKSKIRLNDKGRVRDTKDRVVQLI
jgi:hypothetical protein